MDERAPNKLRITRHHRWPLAAAGAVCVLAFALEERPGGRVAVRGLDRLGLPPICAARAWLGVNCPGCGLTRSIIHLAAGDWRAAWQSHRLGWLAALCITFQIPYRLIALRRPDRPLLAARWQVALAYVLVALLIGNWVVDVVAGRVASV